MLQADESTLHALRDAVRAASSRPELHDRVNEIYQDLASQIAARRPLCSMSGRCCRFEDFGHRLFVTTAELATFLHGFQQTNRPSALEVAITQWDGTGCPFQLAKLCGVHPLRPFGCRIYFCDPTATEWQNAAYESFHTRLKHLHTDLAIPYYYIEWRQALRTLLPDLPQHLNNP
jgi:Fe-S-cluster containining protein